MLGSSSITSPPAKILLSSSTKISLHDRFTKLAKAKPEASVANASSSPTSPAARGLEGRQASAKNQRLALQMANRPTVKAALKIKKKSIQQRLGAPVGGKNIGEKRLNPLGLRKRLSGVGIDQSRLGIPNRNANLSARLGNSPRKSIGGNNNQRGPNRMYKQNNMIKDPRMRRLGGNPIRNRMNNNLGQNRRMGNRVGGVQNKKLGKAQAPVAGGDPTKVKQTLDMDLEQYMAKSKSHLDADLDVYMAQAPSTTNN